MRSRRTLIAVTGVVGTLAALSPVLTSASASASGAPTFTAPLQLKGYAGGEPSLALDPSNSKNVYVTAPQGIPTGANLVLGGSTTSGVGFWASHDGGKTFPIAKNIGSAVGGGDSDVEVGSDGTVYVADLEAAGASICTSTDHGRTFTSGNAAKSGDDCKDVTTNQQGPENDRQWLNVGKGQPDAVYLTYHDFAGGFPIIERSDDHGATFAPCGTILDPAGPAFAQYSPTNGTLVAKPAIDYSGRMFVEVTEPPLNSPPIGASLNSLFIAVAPKGCPTGTTFKNYKIYSDPGADLGKIFNSVTVDRAGNVYVIAAGKTKANQTTTNVWMFVSHDHGVHWSAPIRVNSTSLKANVMPAVVGGLKGNEVAVGWFGTANSGDPNYQKNQWRYYVATSFDGGRHFAQTTVTRSPIHYGDICTQGLFCTTVNDVTGAPSNRNLADFDMIAVDPHTGQLIVAFPGDPWNRPDINGHNDFSSAAYIVRQTGGRPLR
jgi:hypothetical protein